MKFILLLSFFVNQIQIQILSKSTYNFHNVINDSSEQDKKTDANSEQHKIIKRNAVHRVEHVFNANGITHLNNCSYPDHYCNPTSPSLLKKVDTSINGPLGKSSSKIIFVNWELGSNFLNRKYFNFYEGFSKTALRHAKGRNYICTSSCKLFSDKICIWFSATQTVRTSPTSTSARSRPASCCRAARTRGRAARCEIAVCPGGRTAGHIMWSNH